MLHSKSCAVGGCFSRLAITYDNRAWTDGLGAQLQRILGIYALSRLLKCYYIHSGLWAIDYQGLSPLLNRNHDPQLCEKANQLFNIKSDVLPSRISRVKAARSMTTDQLAEVNSSRYFRNIVSPGMTLVKLVLPYEIIDRHPESYKVCASLTPFRPTSLRTLRVAVHVRRGELFAVNPERMLPNSYYLRAAATVSNTLETLGFDYQIEVHTEIPEQAAVITPGDTGIGDRLACPVPVSPADCSLQDFSDLPRCNMHLNEPVLSCLSSLATADILIMSKSSFSYVAGILNAEAIKICPRFWHPPLSDWIRTDSNGEVDEIALGQKLSLKKAYA